MKNPFRHQSPTDTDAPVERAVPTGPAGAHAWHHMQQDVDPDCVRDPGSDLIASWDLEYAAAEEAYEQEQRRAHD